MGTYLLGIDIGTSACKVALFDEKGQVQAQDAGEYTVQYPHLGWAEQNPDTWWDAVCGALQRMMAVCGVDAGEIAGVGVDGQSWSAIAMDAQGNVLTPTPIWTDTRARDICEEMRGIVPERDLFALCGNPLQPSYTFPKILWYKQHMPEVYKKTEKILQANSYIVYRLTGVVSQDRSQGYGLCCYDMRRGQWDTGMCERLGVRPSLLPELYHCHQVVGGITGEAARLTGLRAGTPVVAGGLDAACGTLGAGVIAPGQTQEQGGQAGGMSICLDTYAADERLILGAHVVPERWLLQGGSTGGGGALKWFRETACPELSFADMSELAAQAPAGSEGVLFLPYMAGERSPIWNPNACGVFFGLSYAKTRGHLIRAVMEGTAYALRQNLETAKEAGANPGTLYAMGGAANSLVWTQMKADITGYHIEVPGSDTATTWGAALLAGVGAGVFADFEEAVQKTVSVKRRHTPNPSLAGVYDASYAKYLELYARLEPMMRG